jgi:glycosyltransferase involved in cell wall biosynthesis
MGDLKILYVSISNADRSPDLEYTATVYNGVNVDEFSFQAAPLDYLLFFGRIHPDKGVYEAVQISKASKRKLIISGLIQDHDYFEKKVKPFIDDINVHYVGNLGPVERNDMLGNAYALLHPICFDEPFGLSVVEAMMCGTPVIAFNRGSMSELISNGKTGFLVETIEAASAAVKNVTTINRAFCRQLAASRFSRKNMIDGYLEVYEKILAGKKVSDSSP